MSIFYIPHINFNHSQRNNPLFSTPAAKQTRIAAGRKLHACLSYLNPLESEGHFEFWQVRGSILAGSKTAGREWSPTEFIRKQMRF